MKLAIGYRLVGFCELSAYLWVRVEQAQSLVLRWERPVEGAERSLCDVDLFRGEVL